MSRTNIDIDDEACAAIMRRYHLVSKREAVNLALRTLAGPVEIAFGHNDLHAANFIDDGDRIWLIDWEYAGFNSPLYDLGGLAANNELDVIGERWLTDRYFGTPVCEPRLASYAAMKCASILRDAMWGMVSELHSKIDFDYVAFTEENIERFERAWHALAR